MRVVTLRNTTPICRVDAEIAFTQRYVTIPFPHADIENVVFFAGRLFWLSDLFCEESDWRWYG